MSDEKGKQHQQHGKPVDKGQKARESFEKSFEKNEPKEDIRLIVRVAGIDLDGRKPIERSMSKIKGIGVRMSKNIAVAFEKSYGIPASQKTGKLSEEQSKKLEEVVLNPQSSACLSGHLTRERTFTREEFASGDERTRPWLEVDLQRMTETKSYKGLRHNWGLPVRDRGQRALTGARAEL